MAFHQQADRVVQPQEYRKAMRNQASTVAIVACGEIGNRCGSTVTAACSLSDAPAAIMIGINRNSRVHDAIIKQGSFSLNMLSTGQKELAITFSGASGLAGEAHFDDVGWTVLQTGAPILLGSLSTFDCAVSLRHEYSTHSIFVGTVRALREDDAAMPLLYFRGAYISPGESPI